MKIFAFLCSLVLLLSSCQGLFHRVDVFAKRTGSDIGNTVEVRTNVRFFGTPLSETQTRTGLKESMVFPGNGERIFGHLFGQDPVSVLVTVTEDDGNPGTNDGVCQILIQPPSFPLGSSRYECHRDSDNGVIPEWTIIMTMTSVFPEQ